VEQAIKLIDLNPLKKFNQVCLRIPVILIFSSFSSFFIFVVLTFFGNQSTLFLTCSDLRLFDCYMHMDYRIRL